MNEFDGRAVPSLHFPLARVLSPSVHDLSAIKSAIRDVPDFPKPGILFKDITPVLGSGDLFRSVIDHMIESLEGQKIDKVAGIDARGFIFGAAIADRLGIGFVPIRKKGKLPWQTIESSYSLEYGEATVQVHKDAVTEGEKVILVDDLLATGGTAAAAVKLLSDLGADLVDVIFFIELAALEGRSKLGATSVTSLITY